MLTTEEKTKIVSDNKLNETDTGSAEVQVALLSEEIQKLHKITILKEEKKQIEEELKILNETKDVTAMYKKAGMEPPHPGKGIHTKKFHKCVTSVGKKGEVDNPYAVCMSSLGKEKAVKASLELMKK
jgi:small subunit ribosomal protein S15